MTFSCLFSLFCVAIYLYCLKSIPEQRLFFHNTDKPVPGMPDTGLYVYAIVRAPQGCHASTCARVGIDTDAPGRVTLIAAARVASASASPISMPSQIAARK